MDIKGFLQRLTKMDPKESLKNSIKEWLLCDVEIATKRQEIKALQTKKLQASSDLLQTMKTHNLDEIDTNNGRIIYKKSKIKKAISTKFLTTILQDYYDKNVDEADAVTHFILQNREEHVKESLTCKRIVVHESV